MSKLITVLECSAEHAVASSPLEALLEAAGSVTLHLNEAGTTTFTSRNLATWAGGSEFSIGSSFLDLFENAARAEVGELLSLVFKQGKIVEFSAPLHPAYGRSIRWKLCR